MAQKKRGLFHQLLFAVNSGFALLLLLSYILPYIPPKSFPYLSVLSLGVPPLLFINAGFALYWLIRRRIEMLLSLIVLLIGYQFILSYYKFSSQKDVHSPDNISLLSYNVHNFDWMGIGTPEKIVDFVNSESPDIVCFQEYYDRKNIHYKAYPYRYFDKDVVQTELAIFSKYPIVNAGSLDFPNTGNNAVYADIVKHNDTIRVFNMHLQSHSIASDFSRRTFEEKRKIKNVAMGFSRQQEQVKILRDSLKASPYKNIVGGDTNNSVFSYTYRELTKNYQDAFKKAGHGLGRTFVYDKFIPIRMDLILTDMDFTINNFKTYDVPFSDHYPIKVKFELTD